MPFSALYAARIRKNRIRKKVQAAPDNPRYRIRTGKVKIASQISGSKELNMTQKSTSAYKTPKSLLVVCFFFSFFFDSPRRRNRLE